MNKAVDLNISLSQLSTSPAKEALLAELEAKSLAAVLKKHMPWEAYYYLETKHAH
jgi:hypothetical protein